MPGAMRRAGHTAANCKNAVAGSVGLEVERGHHGYLSLCDRSSGVN